MLIVSNISDNYKISNGRAHLDAVFSVFGDRSESYSNSVQRRISIMTVDRDVKESAIVYSAIAIVAAAAFSVMFLL